jgi:hypothetical protein
MVIDACTEFAGSWYRAVVEEDRTARADFIVYSPLAVCLPYDSLGSCAALSRSILQQCRKAGPTPPVSLQLATKGSYMAAPRHYCFDSSLWRDYPV